MATLDCPLSLIQAYAMTEASHQMTSNPLPKFGTHKPGTVGKAQGTVKVRGRALWLKGCSCCSMMPTV